MEYIPAFEQAVKDVANNISPTESPVYVGFEGSFGDNMISPRNLDASHLGRTICVEAIVTRCTFLYIDRSCVPCVLTIPFTLYRLSCSTKSC